MFNVDFVTWYNGTYILVSEMIRLLEYKIQNMIYPLILCKMKCENCIITNILQYNDIFGNKIVLFMWM